MTVKVDAHQHFWHVARRDYAWLTADAFPILYRDFDPADLEPLLHGCGIAQTILVQGAQTEDETNFLLQIANATPFVAGVVGWVDLTAENAAQRVEEMARNPKLIGLRPMLEVIEDDEWILQPQLKAGIQAMIACGLRFDALIRPRHLPLLQDFAEQFPDLPIVIDHAGKPDIAGRDIDQWAADIQSIADSTDVKVKLSGLATEAEPGWHSESLRPYTEVLFDAFGASRMMWGSDWPVLLVAGDYLGWHQVSQTLTEHLSVTEKDWLFGRTAADFYGIQEIIEK